MHHPFALTPCGHIACHACLVQWFTTPTNGSVSEDIPVPPPIHRKKTCPHCRGIVKEKPVCVWNVKTLVSTLAASSLLPNPIAERPADPPADPWADIFPDHTNADHDINEVGILDEEDGY